MRPPANYDALRQAEQQAREEREAPPKPEAAAQLDSAQPEPVRPTNHPGSQAPYNDRGEPVVSQTTRFDAAEIARAAKEREEAAARAKEQDKGQGR